jgi:hypothetical protein
MDRERAGEDMDETGRQIGELREAMRAGFDEMRTEFRAVRTEMKEEFHAMRTEMKDVRTEMKEEFRTVRGEMKEEFRAVRGETIELRGEMNGRFDSSENRMMMLAVAVIGGFVAMGAAILVSFASI